MANVASLLSNQPSEPDRSRGLEVPVTWGVVRSSVLRHGDRRIEAETYLSDGYGRRMSIETRPDGWSRLRAYANVWQPSRLKGITVPDGLGTPFLSAGQMFEAQPQPRKWLASHRTPDVRSRLVRPGTLLLSCSGTVGRATLSYSVHADHIITHDLLRIEPTDSRMRGWLYAYMRTATFRAIARGAHYGHMIKHLEPEHVSAMPVLDVPDSMIEHFDAIVTKIFEDRNRAAALTARANLLYREALGLHDHKLESSTVFTVPAVSLATGRRRLDAYHHNDAVAVILGAMRRSAHRVEALEAVTRDIWWPNRFSRAFAPDEKGTPYVSAVELFDLNPPITKHIHTGLLPNSAAYFVEPGWLIMARSGQIYGLNGRLMLTNERHSRFFFSEDLLRIVPSPLVARSGYLMTVVGHPELGRPMVLRHAYGTSIPHLEPSDLAGIPIPRFGSMVEDGIADLAEEAAALRSSADDAEDAVTAKAEQIIAAFLHDVDLGPSSLE